MIDMPVNPNKLVKRTLIASGDGNIQWVGSDNVTKHPVDRLELYGAAGKKTWKKSPSPCKLKKALKTL